MREVLVIAAALSIQDPRERPVEHQQAATEQHARFADPDSDFLTLLNLWNYLREQQQALSSNQFRRLCRAEFLNYLRVREWQDLESQLRQVVRGLGVTLGDEPAPAVRVHQALLAGLLSHLGLKDPLADKPDYLGARGARFAIFPGSALARRNPRWVMAAELVETSRLWARIVARIEPEWVERLAGHLVKRSYSEPHWEKDQGAVDGPGEGHPVRAAAGRRAQGRLRTHRPGASRGNCSSGTRWSRATGDPAHLLRGEPGAAGRGGRTRSPGPPARHPGRRRDAVRASTTSGSAAEVVSGRHFDSWWKRIRRTDPDLLTFTAAMLVNDRAGRFDQADFPDTWQQGELSLPLTYQFEPGTEADGVTVHIPLALLGQVRADGFDWQVPGLREELVTALIRSLPKPVRRNFVPVPDHARAFLDLTTPLEGSLLAALETHFRRHTGVTVSRRDWDLAKVPDHLRITFRVEDGDRSVAEGKDLEALRRQLAPKARAAVAEATEGVERGGLTAWTPGTLARVVQRRRAGHDVTAYPALVDETDSVAVRVFETEVDQARSMWAGTRRLLMLEVPTPIPLLSKRLSNAVKLGLTRYPYGNVPDLLDDCVRAAVDAIITREGGPTFDDARYQHLREATRADLPAVTVDTVVAVEKVVAVAHEVRTRLAAPAPPALAASIEDMRAQLVALIQPGFVTATGLTHLADLPRYLHGIERRLERLPNNPGRDRDWMDQVAAVRAEYEAVRAALPPRRRDDPDVRAVRWMIEELRISYFAQELRTPYPISDVRIYRVLDDLESA